MAISSYSDANGRKLFEVYVNGLGSGGRRFQKRKRGIESLRQAQVEEFELKRELAKIREEAVPFRWEEWLDICLNRIKMTYQPSTFINYRTTLNKWLTPQWRGLEISLITREQVYKAIFENINPDLKPHTRKCILKFVKRIFQMAVEDGHLVRNPCLGIRIRVPEVDQAVLTANEVNIFLGEAKALDHRFYPVWTLAVMTGMRSGELYALRWTDIDLDAGNISVARQWTSKNGFGPTKTRRSRVVPISEDLSGFLKELKLKTGMDEFVLPRLREWQSGNQAQITKVFCKELGITPIKFHDLRATFITNLLAHGESLARVMAMVCHTELKTTNGYLRKAGVEVQGATERLGYKVPKSVFAQVLELKNQVK
jgi:integrase